MLIVYKDCVLYITQNETLLELWAIRCIAFVSYFVTWQQLESGWNI